MMIAIYRQIKTVVVLILIELNEAQVRRMSTAEGNEGML